MSTMPPPPPPYGAPVPPPAPGYPYSYAYAQPPRRNGFLWALAIIAVIGFVVIMLAAIGASMMKTLIKAGAGASSSDDIHTVSTGFGSSSIGVIEINGVIMDADKIDRQLESFGKDASIKAIVLHINSPGGGAAASQEIYHEVLRVRQEHNKKVVASIESVGASGAYYIASACDRIYANQASVVGSIGVIMEWTNYGDLMKWAKLKPVVMAKGELKDAGDPTRDMTPQEKVYFESLVDNMYAQFVHDVAVGRHTDPAKIQPLATGQVWTGQQAQPLGLIDQQGGFRDAVLDTARVVGISGEPKITKPAKDKHGLLALMTGDTDDADSLFPVKSQLLNQSPGFYFLWK